ncbi:MAG: hypothetical protein KGZ86_05975 [Candidatus Latescibacteria bacterium]|nr:hypothetical protein [Candidatus Latescibacterota bacterium]
MYLKHYLGLDRKAIALKLNISIMAVKELLAKANKKFKKKWIKECGQMSF